MKILMVHNKYKQNGGEDTVFYNEMSLLKAKGHMVDKLIFENSRINNIFSKLKIGISGIYNIESANMLKDKIKKFKPDVIHVHNSLPFVSPSIFWVAKKFKIPVVLTLHNYRLICPNAILFRNGNICEKCMDKIFPYSGIIHKCYRNSFMQTLSLSLVTNIHKYIKTWHSKVDKFITLTNFQKNKFLSSNMNISEEKFLVKSNFVDDFGNGYKNRENYFVYVGRLSIEKGIITI